MADRSRQLRVALVAFGVVFLLWASRQPDAHLSLIWFTDVAALFLVAAVLGVLTPRGVTARAAAR